MAAVVESRGQVQGQWTGAGIGDKGQTTREAGNCNEMRVMAPKSTEMQTMCVNECECEYL